MKILTKILLGTLLSTSSFAASKTTRPFCQWDQLSIHPIAIYSGGMMQTRVYFILKNTDNTSCILPSGSRVSISPFVKPTNTIACHEAENITATPYDLLVRSSQQSPDNSLGDTWISIHADDATQPDDPSFHSTVKKIAFKNNKLLSFTSPYPQNAYHSGLQCTLPTTGYRLLLKYKELSSCSITGNHEPVNLMNTPIENTVYQCG